MNGSCLIELLVAGGKIFKGGNFSVLIQRGDWMFTVTLSLTNFCFIASAPPKGKFINIACFTKQVN